MKEEKEYIRHPTHFLHSIHFMSSHGECTCYNVAAILIVYLIATLFTYDMFIVEELMDQLWWYCAGLSTSMTFGTDVDQNILNSFLRAPRPAVHGVAILAKTNMAASRYFIFS